MSDQPVLRGQKLFLRALERADITDAYVRWLNDPDVTRYLETGREPVSKDDIDRYLRRFEGSSSDFIFGIFDQATGRHVGNVTLNRIDRVHGTADTGLMIGDKAFWARGYASEAWSLVVGWAFADLGLRKIVAGACEPNVASARALQRLGFRLEGIHRGECLVDGQHVDALRFGLFRDEFRPFLTAPNAPHTVP